MLRYIYLLNLLVCIESVFCYDYISDGSDMQGKRSLRKGRSYKNNGIFKRQEYEANGEGFEDRGPVAKIDVARFIQIPDYESLEDNEPTEKIFTNRKQTSKGYGDYGTFSKSEEDNSQIKDKNYNNMDDSHHEYNLQEFASNSEHAYDENRLVDKNKVRKPKNKSLAQKMKIPFFSYKTESQKTKKYKKRKLLRNTSKKKVTVSSNFSGQSNRNSDQYDLNKKKRSYQEHICSICKRKFLVSVKDAPDNKHTGNNVIHNSRQYFQALEEKNRGKMNQGSTNISEAEEADENTPNEKSLQVNEDRAKRQDGRERQLKVQEEEEDRERQLKELEEVRKRIDNVEISMPVFQRPG